MSRKIIRNAVPDEHSSAWFRIFCEMVMTSYFPWLPQMIKWENTESVFQRYS
ncbi:MAG: hypothetical protein PUA84_06025 [Oscillospiraceae bacterium]|nr:hypothetical protein [Oscillospiraceae bacterium]